MQLNSTLGPMAEIFTAVSTGLNGYDQARASRAEGAYMKSIYDSNANLAELSAQDAIDRGNKAATKHLKSTKQLIGAQRAALAAQGIEVNADDALAIQMDTAGLGAMDALEIKNNAWREAWGYKVQGANYSSQGTFSSLAAKNKSRSTILTAGMNITKDLVYSQYLRKNKSVPTYDYSG